MIEGKKRRKGRVWGENKLTREVTSTVLGEKKRKEVSEDKKMKRGKMEQREEFHKEEKRSMKMKIISTVCGVNSEGA